MTLLALLCALGISHAWRDIEGWRRHELLAEPARRLRGRGALPAIATLALALLAGGLLSVLAERLLGDVGMLLAGIVVLLFVLGPRDLDRDIEAAAAGEEEAAAARQRLCLPVGASATDGAAAALHGGLARWFGVLFWFAVAGIPGALLYRAVRVSRRAFPPGRDERRAFDAILGVLNWPVVGLMTLSIALMTDFDRALDRFDARADRWRFPARLLDDLAGALCTTDGGLAAGLEAGRQLARRVLMLWLVVVAVLLLIGVLA
ncbi:regulatory signaling modulator protein AmpE [Wenzhouxiangella sp. XN79A]|uniref:regulatory signaling modulator protein AmpE n=1 Tax=Wenzhouxiangella sp. XN79A TaxID=2724193 RepID=UPI00144AE730|nr:regulatory signaling modulator protein AmpE [Wenzhouxiangella sp. XN79A]NKI35680.1 regulatory signaling modulator protein AmpE [Wenzhouxiangella sp. XN79A]